MSAEAFNGRVRDGIGFGRLARTTGPAKNKRSAAERILGLDPRNSIRGCEASMAVGISEVGPRSKGRLPTAYSRLPVLSKQDDPRTRIMRTIKPIERLVPVSFTHCCASTPGLSTWSSSTALIGSYGFEVGFPLRCLQRLSRPYIATLHCGWRHNSSTRGTSIPVLSY